MCKRIFQASILLTFIILPRVTLGSTDVNNSKTFDGYTLIAPNFHTTTYLIDMDGNVVHYWLNDGTPAISAYLLENGNLLRTSTIPEQSSTEQRPAGPGGFGGGIPGFGGMGGFGGGMMGMASKGGGAGGRIQEINWDGKVVWEFVFSSPDHLLNHDIKRMPNGNILCIAWERKTAQEAIDAGRDTRMQGNSELRPDFIIEVKPDKVNNGGEIVWQWHVWDHLIQDFDKNEANYGDVSAHPELVDLNFTANRTVTPASGTSQPAMPGFGGAPGGMGGMTMMGLSGAGGTVPPDWMHTNAIDYNPDLDQIAISCYGFSEIWIIDHSTTTEQAKGHTGGKYGKGGDLIYRWGNPRAYRAGTEQDQKFFNQHNVHWIVKGRPGAGHIMVFNNGPYRSDGDYSSVDEIITPVDAKGKYPLEKGKAYGPKEAVWSYSAQNKTDFYSMHISGAERQPNGNTLICSGAYGVMFEVTPDKKVIWRCAYSGGDGPNGPDLKSAFGGMGGFTMPNMGGGFGGPGGRGGFGGFPGMPGSGGQQPAATQELPRFVVTREDPAVSGLKGMPSSLQRWGGGTGFGVMETQIFRVYRYATDYPGLKGKDLTVIVEKK